MPVQHNSKIKKTATFTNRPFEKLRKKMEDRKSVSPPAPSPVKKEKPVTEEELFSTAMSGVQVREEFRELPYTPPRRKPPAGQTKCDPDREALMVLDEIATGRRPMELSNTQEYVEWTNPAYRGDVTERLREGRFSIQATLDLHGHTALEAEAELDAFLGDSFKKGLGCVKIIHGRGLRSTKGPILKKSVTRLLSGHYRKHIIAYVTARQCDGGLGALYVLLRKK